MLPQVRRNAAPCLIAGFTGLRNGMETPQLLSGLRVVRGDDASFARVSVVAGAAGKDLPLCDQRSRTLNGGQLSIILNPSAPGRLTGTGVQRVNEIIGAEIDDLVVVDRDVPVFQR